MQGVDFNIRYSTMIGDTDRLTLSLNGTYLTAYKVAFTPGGDFKSLKNRIFNPLTFKARAAASWEHGPFTLRGEMTHIGGYNNDIVTPVQKIKSYTIADLSLNWDVSKTFDMSLKSVSLGFEVRNLFDTDPPYVNSIPGGNGGGGYDPTVTNPIGREFAVSLRTKI
jgi:iron complex outermembrane receptor protein